MIAIEKLNDYIHYFKVPYKDIFVGIYVLQTDKGTVLFDTAGCNEDIDNWIQPALDQLNVTPTHIFISHNHADHAGGLARAAELFPDATIITRSDELKQAYPNSHCPEDGELLLDTLQVVTIPGHTTDSAALLDLRSNTLVSGDCLQSYGIYGSGYWYANITFPAEHFAAVEKVRKLKIDTVATAHDYHPVGMISQDAESITLRLDSCLEALNRVRSIAEAHPELEPIPVAKLCNDGTLPKVASKVIVALRKAADEGRI